MEKWAYRIEAVTMADRWSAKAQAQEIEKLQNRLNEWGKTGWEMISYESIPMYGSFSHNLKGYAYLVFWKQKISDDSSQ